MKNVTCLCSQLPCQWARPRSPSCGCWGWRGHSTWESGAERAPQSGCAASVNSEHPAYYGSPVRKLFRSFRVTMSSENEKLETTHIWELNRQNIPTFWWLTSRYRILKFCSDLVCQDDLTVSWENISRFKPKVRLLQCSMKICPYPGQMESPQLSSNLGSESVKLEWF